MSTSFVEKLYTVAEAVVTKSIRLVGGKDPAGTVIPLEIDAAGGVVVNQRAVPVALSQRLQYQNRRSILNKGTLKKFKTRLSILGESQESSRNVVGTVTTNKLTFVSVIGIFQVGETITGSVSLATGTITRVTSTFIEYTVLLGTFVTGDIITGGTSLATTTIISLTTPNLIGQIIKIPQDNIDGLMITVETDPPSNSLDLFEASTLNMALMWSTIGIPPIRDAGNKTQGTASVKLDQSVATTYTHTVSYIKHGLITAGPFQVNEVITGGISGATAVIGAIDNGLVRVLSVVGIFQSGEVITGSVSTASAITTSVLLASEDWTGFENINFDVMFSTKNEQGVKFTISDGVNSSSTTLSNTFPGVFETKTIPLAALATQGIPAAVNLAGITSYSFTTALKFKPTYNANIDNLVLTGVSGSMGLSFYDLGPNLPVSGVATLSGGTQKMLGDIGFSSIQVPIITPPLDGGKRILRANNFVHGVSLGLPTETFLVPGNYYGLVFTYIDTDVKIYGNDPTLPGGYPNGYAFSTSSLSLPIVSIGVNVDCMFSAWTSESVFLDRVELIPNAAVGISGEFLLVVEDAIMNMRVLANGFMRDGITSFEFKENPVFLPKGGKLELYYIDEFLAPVRHIDVTSRYWSAKQDSYVANP